MGKNFFCEGYLLYLQSTKSRSRAAVARRAHNPKVGGSNPPFATIKAIKIDGFLYFNAPAFSPLFYRIPQTVASNSFHPNR